MKKAVFLLEEQSMEELLRGVLPRIWPGTQEHVHWVLVPHQGKSDLEQSIPRKIRALGKHVSRFVIVRDQDAGSCVAVKKKLCQLARDAGRPDTIVRIVCRELEAWYFGEPQALADFYGDPTLATIGRKARYRNPDAIVQPSHELKKLIAEFGKTSAARHMGTALSLEPNANRSCSFNHLIKSIRQLAGQNPITTGEN